jgi:H+/gluconate symporter-like permease
MNGQMFNGIGTMLLIGLIAMVCTVVFGIYIIADLLSPKKEFKTKEKPNITWELQAKGQSVDTVWIYKFK